MSAPTCAAACLLVEALVIALGRSTGAGEAVVRQNYGIPHRAPPEPPALVAAALRAQAPTTDPTGWLQAIAHYLTHPETT